MDTFVNNNPKDQVVGSLAMRVETKTINRHEKRCVMCRHPYFDDVQESCYAFTFAHAIVASYPDHCFQVEETVRPESEQESTVTSSLEKETNQEDIDSGVELHDGLRYVSSRREDADLHRSIGLDTDDGNEPVPKSAPDAVPPAQTSATLATSADGLKEDQSGGSPGVDGRKNHFKVKPQAVGITRDNTDTATALQWFLLFLGWPIINLVIKCTNKNSPAEKPMDRGEFLHFLGLWSLMSAIGGGFDKMEHWSSTISNIENGAPLSIQRMGAKESTQECSECVTVRR